MIEDDANEEGWVFDVFSEEEIDELLNRTDIIIDAEQILISVGFEWTVRDCIQIVKMFHLVENGDETAEAYFADHINSFINFIEQHLNLFSIDWKDYPL